MRYITVLKGTPPAGPPPENLMAAIMDLGGQAAASGALLDTAGLAPSDAGAQVTVAAGELAVTDGPFAEAKEYISYAVYEVRSKEEAIEWASRFMSLHAQHWPGWEGQCDVVKIMGPEDFPQPN